MSSYVQQTQQVTDLLTSAHNIVSTFGTPALLKSVLAALAAMLCLYLLQAMTWEAGISSMTGILRLIQRVSLGMISAVLMLVAASAFAEVESADAMMVLFLIPFLTMLAASAALVHHQQTPRRPLSGKKSGRPRLFVFGSRKPIA